MLVLQWHSKGYTGNAGGTVCTAGGFRRTWKGQWCFRFTHFDRHSRGLTFHLFLWWFPTCSLHNKRNTYSLFSWVASPQCREYLIVTASVMAGKISWRKENDTDGSNYAPWLLLTLLTSKYVAWDSKQNLTSSLIDPTGWWCQHPLDEVICLSHYPRISFKGLLDHFLLN